jgi:hypothetical protein
LKIQEEGKCPISYYEVSIVQILTPEKDITGKLQTSISMNLRHKNPQYGNRNLSPAKLEKKYTS